MMNTIDNIYNKIEFKEEGYVNSLCLVDKLQVVKFINELINIYSMNFEYEETSTEFIIKFNNVNYTFLDDFYVKIDDSGKLLLSDLKVRVQTPNELTSFTEDDNIKELSEQFECVDFSQNFQFIKILSHQTSNDKYLSKFDLKKQKAMLFILGYIAKNVKFEYSLVEYASFIGILSITDKIYFCSFTNNDANLEFDNGEKIKFDNLNKSNVDVNISKCTEYLENKKIKTIKTESFPKSSISTINSTTSSSGSSNYKSSRSYNRSYSRSSGYHRKSYSRNTCPYCGATVYLKHGRYGPFYGCSNWPSCNYTRDA